MEFVDLLSHYHPWRDFDVQEFTHYQKFAAILVPLIFINDELHLLLTVRAKRLSRYSGDAAFPGGMLDKEDSLDFIKAALREAEEEVGLKPQDVKILCTLRPSTNQYEILVLPVVALITNSDFKPKANVSEVSECFFVKLSALKTGRNDFRQIILHGIPLNIFWLHVRDSNDSNRIIWGLTANVIILLLLIHNGRNKIEKGSILDIPFVYTDASIFPLQVKNKASSKL